MNRTANLCRLLVPALLAVAPACKDDAKCIQLQLECRGVCVDSMADPNNCGACGHVCGTGEGCTAGECQAQCASGQELCGSVCVDTASDRTHCGDCTTVCAANGVCVAGDCHDPLALLQTSFMDRTEPRGLYLLEDGTFDLTLLSGPNVVVDHVLLPNGDALVVAAVDVKSARELYRIPARGGAPIKLSGPLVTGGHVQPGVVVSRDGSKVLYRADAEDAGTVELYVVALAQPGVATKVNGTLTPSGNVTRVVELSADGRRVAYVADGEVDEQYEAYTVDLSAATPGPAVLLGSPGNNIYDLHLTPDGSKVVVRGSFGPTLAVIATADPTVYEEVINSDGGEGYVENYQLSADGSQLFYTQSRFFLEDSLWVAPMAGTSHDSTLLVDGSSAGDVRGDFVVTPDAARVYFRQTDLTTASIQRLYYIEVADPATKVLLSSPDSNTEAEVTDFALSRDRRGLAYRGGADGAEGGSPQPHTQPPFLDNDAPALYFVDLSQSAPAAPVLLTPALAKGQEGIDGGYLVTDDRRVLFRGDFDTASFSDAYLAAPATAGTLRKVSPPLDGTTDETDVSLMSLF